MLFCHVAAAALALAQAHPDAKVLCATPQRAALAFVDNLDQNSHNPELAATCAEVPSGLDEVETRNRVELLKRIFDAKGYKISVDKLPDQANYIDPSTSRAEVALHRGLPEVVLAHDAIGWRFPAQVIERVPDLANTVFILDLSGLVERLPNWMRHPLFGVAGWQLVYLLLLVMLGIATRVVVAWFVSGQLQRWMARWNAALGQELLPGSQSLGTLAMAGVLAVGLSGAHLTPTAHGACLFAIRLIAALSAVMVLYRVVDLFSAFLLARARRTQTKLDDQLVPFVRKGLKVVVIALGVVFVLQNLDIDVGSLLAGLGLGGLAIALAAKDTLANFFGSLTIFLDKPFQIGDWVAVAGAEGTIEEVGFRSTRVRTIYDSLVSVPNAKIVDASIDNYGQRRYRRILTTLQLAYRTPPLQVEALCDGVRAMIQAHPKTRKDAYEVHVSGLGESTVQVMVRFFLTVGSWSEELRHRHEIFLDVLRLADRLQVEWAYPTRTLHVASQAAANPAAAQPPLDVEQLRQRVAEFAPGGSAVIAPGPRVGEPHLPGSGGAHGTPV